MCTTITNKNAYNLSCVTVNRKLNPLYAPLEGEKLFAHAESWPLYWPGLARGLIVRVGGKDTADQAIEMTPAEIRQWLEELARQLAPRHTWLGFLVARRLLQAPDSDLARAELLLMPLLDHPPDDSYQCHNLATLILDRLPDLAARTEPMLRHAIELNLKDPLPWFSLGALLTIYLNRYEEAEATYHRASEPASKG